MTNFRHSVEIIEVYPDDLAKGKKIRVIHRFQEYPDEYFAEQAHLRELEAKREAERLELRARIDEWWKSDSTRLDLGDGRVMVKPGRIKTPTGIQPRTLHLNSLPVLFNIPHLETNRGSHPS